MKKRFLTLASSVVLGLLACSSNDGNGTEGPFTPVDGGGGGAPSGQPSGALIRLFNGYIPMNDEAPGSIDIYPDAFAMEDARPLVSVPFGTLSEPFDPTVKGEGNMSLSMYWAGTKGVGNALMTKTETLRGGEVITYFLVTGPVLQGETGRRLGALQAFFHDPTSDNEIPAGKGLLTVSSVGLDAVLPDPSAVNYLFSIGGEGCAKAVGDTEFSTSGVGPGSSATYAFDPGSYVGAVYDDPTCEARPVVENVAFTIDAGGRSVLYVYGAAPDDLRSVVVPLEPKRAP